MHNCSLCELSLVSSAKNRKKDTVFYFRYNFFNYLIATQFNKPILNCFSYVGCIFIRIIQVFFQYRISTIHSKCQQCSEITFSPRNRGINVNNAVVFVTTECNSESTTEYYFFHNTGWNISAVQKLSTPIIAITSKL